jgi:hypothetical protein
MVRGMYNFKIRVSVFTLMEELNFYIRSVILNLYPAETLGTVDDFQGFQKHFSCIIKLVNIILINLNRVYVFSSQSLCVIGAESIDSVNHQ